VRFSIALLCFVSCVLAGCGGGSTSFAAPAAHFTIGVPGRTPAATPVAYPALVEAAQPIAYYRLNDGGTTLVDSGANHLNGTYGSSVSHGGAALTAASGAASAIFDGAPVNSNVTQNAASVPTNTAFAAPITNFTVEAWIDPAQWNTTDHFVPIVSYGREIQGQAWVLQISPQSTLNFWMKTTHGAAPSYLVKSGALMQPAQTYQVAVTYNGSTVSLYVNGTLRTTMPATGSIDYSGLIPQWGLGIGGALGGAEPIFKGLISDVSVYGTALSATDIANHFLAGTILASPAPTAPPTQSYTSMIAASQPLAYYKLNDTGSTLTDSGPNKLSGVYGANVRHGAAAMTTATDASSIFPGGPVGADVPSNTGIVPANPALQTPTSALTVEAWIDLTDFNRTNAFVPIVSYGRQAIGNVWALQLTPQTTLAFYLKVNGTPSSYLLLSNPLTPSHVYHVVATYDGAHVNMYINGALATTIAAAGSLNYTGFPPQYGLTVGGAAGGSAPIFYGAVNDLAIYPTVLAPATIENHYLTGHIAPTLIEQPGNSDAFVNSIGVVTHLRTTGGPYTNSFPAFASLLEASGIRHIGDSLIATPAFYPQELQQLAAAGIHVSLITDFGQTAQTIAATIPVFSGAIEAIEGVNEPDLSGDPNWVTDTRTFQQMLWNTVKNNPATSSLTVLGPSLTSVASDVSVGNLSAYLDAGSMHDYFDGYNPGTPGWGSLTTFGVYGSLAYNRAICAIVSGAKPLISTENGYGNSPTDSGGVDNATLAKYAPRLYLEHYLSGTLRTTMYEFYDEPGNGNFDDFGLVQQNNAPKTSYYALKSLIAALADPGAIFTTTPLHYVLGGNVNNLAHLLLQKRDGSYELLVWLEVQSYNPNTKTDISVPAQTVTFAPGYTPTTATTETIGDTGLPTASALNFSGGAASLSIDDHVTIVTFK
jgi:hypothetical protein